MEGLDQLFGQIQSNIKQANDRCAYIVLNGADEQFDVEEVFPDSTGHKTKDDSQILVYFKTPEDAIAAAAAEKEGLDGIQITVPAKIHSRKRNNKGQVSAESKPNKKHGWKLVKDIKILIRRHIKGLNEKAPTLAADLKATAALRRETKFLQTALRFLHTGADILTDEADYFENHEQGNEVNHIKKARISLETQVQERLSQIRALLRHNKENPNKKVAMKKLKKSYYCTEVLMRYMRGEKEPKIEQEVMDLVQVKDEVLTDDEEEDHQDDDISEEKTEVDDSPAVVPSKKKKGRYFQL